MARIELKPLPPAEAVAFFRNKGFVIAFDWRDVWQDEHARAFTVAKAMRLDILRDIREAVDRAIAEGTTLAQFRADLEPLLQRKGWWGRKRLTDPKTGETRLVQLGSPRRLRTIFDTNMRAAYAAGAWERAQRVKRRRPYLRYVQRDRPTKRAAHVPWHNTVLPIDHEWWKTHYPPNGWFCGCTAISLSRRDLDRFGFEVSKRAPPIRRVSYKNKRTGEVLRIPKGIDPGFAHNVGRAAAARPIGGAFDLMIEKMEAAPGELARGAVAALVRDPEFPRHLQGAFDGDFPVAVAGGELNGALGVEASILRLSRETAAKQAKHGLAPGDYAIVQRLLDDGEIVREGPRHLALHGVVGGKWWRAVMKTTRDGRELFLTSFHRTDADRRRRRRRRGEVLREPK